MAEPFRRPRSKEEGGWEMSELGETFKAWKEYKKEKKRDNFKSSIEILKINSILFEQKSPTHLRIQTGTGYFDFWPSTGKWIRYPDKYTSRGVFRLVRNITGAAPKSPNNAEKEGGECIGYGELRKPAHQPKGEEG